MNIFDKTCIQILCEDIAPQTEREELIYLRKVLNRYWDVDIDTIKQIDTIINNKKFRRFNKAKVKAEPVIRKKFDNNMDVVEYITDNNNTSHIAKYLNDKNVRSRLNIFDLVNGNSGYADVNTIIEKLKTTKDITIDYQTLQNICDIIPPSKGRGIGRGEVLCKTLLNFTQSKKGDGALNGNKRTLVQIKGYKARLKGHQNYGSGESVTREVQPLFKGLTPPSKLTCKQVCNWFQEHWKELGKSTKELNIKLKQAFSHLLTNNKAFKNVENYWNEFVNSLLSEEKNELAWKTSFLRLILEYYRKTEGWTYMILVDNENGFQGLYISSDMNDIMEHIKVKSWPTGNDDRAAAIAIGYKTPDEKTDQSNE